MTWKRSRRRPAITQNIDDNDDDDDRRLYLNTLATSTISWFPSEGVNILQILFTKMDI